MKRLTLILLLSTLALLGGCKGSKTEAQSASLAPRSINGTGCIVGRWPTEALPLNLKLSSEFNGDFIAEDIVSSLNPLEQMANLWNAPVKGTLNLIKTPFPEAATTGFSETSSFKDSEMGIYKSYTWFTNVSSSALAITQFFGFVDSSPGLGKFIKLTHADIIMNYRDYGPHMTMTLNTKVKYDVPTIVLHEMGHFLGLCHEDYFASVMHPYYSKTNRLLQNFDKDIIQDLYIAGDISNISAMTDSKRVSIPDLPPAGTEVSGVIELRADGECIHKVDGQEIFKHKVNIK